MKARIAMLLLAFASSVFPTAPVHADSDILHVWGPRIRESRPDAHLPLIRSMERYTGRKIDFNISNQIDVMLEVSAGGEIDHALLGGEAARLLMERHGFIAIASANIPVSLFVRDEFLPLTKLDRIAYLQKTGARQIAIDELKLINIDKRLVPFANYQQAVFAFLNEEVDGLIANEKFIDSLAPTLQNNFKKRMEFKNTAAVFFLVAPGLDAETAKQLQALYLSDDEAIVDLFYRRAGLRPIQKIPFPADTTEGSEAN